MSLIKPFAALRPTPDHASRVAAPPYDVMTPAEACALAEANPLSFVHVSRAEVDLGPETDPYSAEVYRKAAENLAGMRAQGVLIQDDTASYYGYRIDHAHGSQTGLVACASVEAYQSGRIKRHELTRPDKEDDRVRQIEALGAQTGPVFLFYPEAPLIDRMIAEVTAGAPLYEVVDGSGAVHRAWRLVGTDDCVALGGEFEKLAALYVADGHHRSAAACRVAASRPGDQAGYFLSVIFPHHQLQILEYNRVVKDLAGQTPAQFLRRLDSAFQYQLEEMPVRPVTTGEFGMYLDGQWYRLTLREPPGGDADPVSALDVSLLEQFLLKPLLEIHDQRSDPRIDFVGGVRGLGELQRRVDQGEAAVAFSLFPTTVQALMSVADAGQIMPPKSTWFEPKLLDGLLSHLIREPLNKS